MYIIPKYYEILSLYKITHYTTLIESYIALLYNNDEYYAKGTQLCHIIFGIQFQMSLRN